MNQEHENLFENLKDKGLLVICAWCREKKVFKILDFREDVKNKGLSHGMCEECSKEFVNKD